MSQELKPCPFCNSAVMPGVQWAQCSNSGCPAFHIRTCDFRMWNTRADHSEDVLAVVDEPIQIVAVAVTRDDDDEGLRLDWLLEGGISELEFAGTVLFAMPEANDLCDEDGGAELYRHPQRKVVMPEHRTVPDVVCPERIHAWGWNACLDEFKRLNPQ